MITIVVEISMLQEPSNAAKLDVRRAIEELQASLDYLAVRINVTLTKEGIDQALGKMPAEST